MLLLGMALPMLLGKELTALHRLMERSFRLTEDASPTVAFEIASHA